MKRSDKLLLIFLVMFSSVFVMAYGSAIFLVEHFLPIHNVMFLYLSIGVSVAAVVMLMASTFIFAQYCKQSLIEVAEAAEENYLESEAERI